MKMSNKGQIFVAAAVIAVIAVASFSMIFVTTAVREQDETLRYKIRNIAREYESTTSIASAVNSTDGSLLDNLTLYFRKEMYPIDVRTIYLLTYSNAGSNTARVVVGNFMKENLNISLSLKNSSVSDKVLALLDKSSQYFDITFTGDVRIDFNYTIGKNRFESGTEFWSSKSSVTGVYDIFVSDGSSMIRKLDTYSVIKNE